MARTFVIGDIHGAFKALLQLMSSHRIQTDDRLIFLGDYVDGWSQSAEVIDYLVALSQHHNCVFIKGNHDVWCQSWLQDNKADSTWLFHGGQATVASYSGIGDAQKAHHLEFFNNMHDYFVDEQDRLFIHAGFSSMHWPERETYASNYTWDRTLWETALALDSRIPKDSEQYPKRFLLFHEIYIGHTPTLYYDVDVPMQGGNVWNVDTGAAFYGKLSAMDVDSKEFWQSDAVQALYPNEKGRNK